MQQPASGHDGAESAVTLREIRNKDENGKFADGFVGFEFDRGAVCVLAHIPAIREWCILNALLRLVGLPQHFREERMTFEDDRNLIASLTDEEAESVLGFLDNGANHADTPTELREALAAAQRTPDVARYFLINKTHRKEHHAAQKRLQSVDRK